MTENAPQWPMMVGTYLEVEGCVDDFGDWIHFCARECEWLGGGQGR